MPVGSAGAEQAVIEAVEQAAAADGSVDASRIGDDLFAVVAILDEQPPLRRAMSEPAVPTAAKESLVQGMLHGHITAGAEQIITTAVAQRWSHSGDLGNALERAGIIAHLVKAEQQGMLDEVEDELFRFGRIVESSRRLRDALSDRRTPPTPKRRLLETLIGAKVSEPTSRLLAQAVVSRGRPFLLKIVEFQELTAARGARLLATARVAKALTSEQHTRLHSALETQYDRSVLLNVIVDPDLLGGVRVSIGNEVMDSTVAMKLAEARRRLAG
jgi:F-type H+-transporting ATPase subunit delta